MTTKNVQKKNIQIDPSTQKMMAAMLALGVTKEVISPLLQIAGYRKPPPIPPTPTAKPGKQEISRSTSGY